MPARRSPATSTPWQNRIVGHGDEDPTQLLANPKNWRTHPANQREALRGALDQVGWVQQVLVNKITGHVVDGHARVEEAITRGESSVPVLYVELEQHEEDVVLATLDPIGALATRNDEALRMLLAEVEFDAQALRDMTDDLMPHDPKTGLTDPDDVPEPPAEPWVKPGDLFALGRHRLLCGDSTKAEDVALVADGAKAECMWTDPPYGVSYVGKTKDALTIQNDGGDAGPETFAAACAVAPLAPSARFYAAVPPGPRQVDFLIAVRDTGWRLHQELVWVKNSMVLGHSDYHYRHEPVLYGYVPGDGRPGRGAHQGTRWHGDHSQTSVLEFDRPQRSTEHPTMKPVALVSYCLGNSTRPGDVVYDPFLGSGSTLIACEESGRSCVAIEIDPRYVQVAIERWEQFTGQKAVKL